MKRLVEKPADHFDMMPFISIMMCMLGCLLLLVMAFVSTLKDGGNGGWVAGPGAGGRQPVLVEWSAQGGIIHGEKGKLEAAETAGLLGYFHGRSRTHYALFAVRPSGFGSFEETALAFRREGIVIGYDPVPESRPLVMKLHPSSKP